MVERNSEGVPLIWRLALAGVGAAVVTFGVWAATDLIFGGAAIIGLLFGVVAFVFTGMAGGEPVLTYQGDGKTAAGAQPWTGASSDSAPAPTPSASSGDDESAAPDADPEIAAAPDAEPEIAAAPDAEPPAPASKAETVGSSDVVKPSAPLPGEAELAEKKGEWRYEAPSDASGEDAAQTGTTPTEAAPTEAAPAETASPATAAGSSDDGAAAQEDSAAAHAEEVQPDLYTDAPADADDLKQIKGVGPGLEKTLNELGIYTFAQIQTWGDSEIAWVDARPKLKGRIARANWVDQAKSVADGGETEYSNRGDNGGD